MGKRQTAAVLRGESEDEKGREMAREETAVLRHHLHVRSMLCDLR